MKPENQVKINCSEMPSVDLRNFCRTFSKALERSAEDPSFMKKYEQYIVDWHYFLKDVQVILEQISQAG